MEPREQARRLYERGRALKDIAAELGVKPDVVRQWKRRGNWDNTDRVTDEAARDKEASRKRKRHAAQAVVREAVKKEALTPKEVEFCLHYVRTYNAETAMLRSGLSQTARSARSHAYEYMRKPEIKAEIERLRTIKGAQIWASVDDLIELHMRIAFADMGDVAAWGKGIVRLHDSETVDGQLIKEISEGPTGVKVKLQDGAASRAFLERFFAANPLDKHRMEYDNARLALEERRVKAEEQRQSDLLDAANNPVVIVDDIEPGGDMDG